MFPQKILTKYSCHGTASTTKLKQMRPTAAGRENSYKFSEKLFSNYLLITLKLVNNYGKKRKQNQLTKREENGIYLLHFADSCIKYNLLINLLTNLFFFC